jgi:WD40 repeat protein
LQKFLFSLRCGRYVATGNQDGTCRVWDIRRPNQEVISLGSVISAVRSAKYSNCGRFLAFAEAADFVHIYDTTNYRECQVSEDF